MRRRCDVNRSFWFWASIVCLRFLAERSYADGQGFSHRSSGASRRATLTSMRRRNESSHFCFLCFVSGDGSRGARRFGQGRVFGCAAQRTLDRFFALRILAAQSKGITTRCVSPRPTSIRTLDRSLFEDQVLAEVRLVSRRCQRVRGLGRPVKVTQSPQLGMASHGELPLFLERIRRLPAVRSYRRTAGRPHR
jgi:hypothetical protein